MTSRPARTYSAQRVFRFGPFRLDTSRKALLRGHTVVSLAGMPLELLILLLEHAGELVTKDTIVQQLWNGAAVSDNSIVQVAMLLRKALGEQPGGGEYIDKRSRGGYRFIAPVSVVTAPVPVVDPDDALEAQRALVHGRVGLESLDREGIERAKSAFALALAREPDLGSAHIGMANACILLHETTRVDHTPDVGVLAEAEEHARTGCRVLPDSADAWATLALVHHRRHLTLDAVAAMRKALTIDPDDWRLHLRLAWVSWGEDRLKAARRVLSEVPGVALAHWFAATVYVARGRLERAREELREGCTAQDLQRDSDRSEGVRFASAGLHWLHGLVLASLGDEDTALDELARETRFDDRGQLYAREASANSWYALGVLHRRAERQDEASKAFGQALQRVATHPMTLLHVNPAAPVSTDGTNRSVVSGIEASIVQAGHLVLSGHHREAARLCGEALTSEGHGSAGWLLPVEPTLDVRAHSDEWARTLSTLRARAC